MRLFTLDTSCVIAAVNGEVDSNHIEELAELAQSGKIDIVVTSALEVDQRRASDERRRAVLEWLSHRPILVVPGPFRFGMSTFNGPDALTEDDIPAVDEAISTIVLPRGVKAEDARSKRMQDVHHLTAHHMAKRDIFVTLDNDDMIRKRGELKSKVGIVIATPSEAVPSLLAADSNLEL
jgi:hypothetical protein